MNIGEKKERRLYKTKTIILYIEGRALLTQDVDTTAYYGKRLNQYMSGVMSLSDVGYKISGYPMVLCAGASRLWGSELADGRCAHTGPLLPL